MNAPLAIAGILTGLVLAVAPALAHKAQRDPAPKPSPALTQTAVPPKADPAPSICLISVNGKSPAAADKAPKLSGQVAQQTAAKTDKTREQPTRRRACDVAAPPAATPLG